MKKELDESHSEYMERLDKIIDRNITLSAIFFVVAIILYGLNEILSLLNK